MLPIVRGLVDSLAIGIGYLPIAFSFGLACVQAGLPPLTGLLISAVMFAGASQFALVALVSAGGSLLAVLSTVVLMNVRHMFYGPTVLAKLGNNRPTIAVPFLAFGLTDEVFATAIGKLHRLPSIEREGWYLGLQLGAYAFWMSGTALGVYLGQELVGQSQLFKNALDFVLPALFMALLLEIGKSVPRSVLLVSVAVTLTLLYVAPGYLAMLGGMLAGASLGYRRGTI